MINETSLIVYIYQNDKLIHELYREMIVFLPWIIVEEILCSLTMVDIPVYYKYPVIYNDF